MRLNRCVAWRAPSLDGRDRFVEAGPGMTERHAVAGRHQRPHQVESARQFRRERDNADVRPGTRRSHRGCRSTKSRLRARGRRTAGARQSAGCAPRYSGLMKLLSRCAGSTRALRAARERARRPHLRENRVQLRRGARDRRGAERRDTVTRRAARPSAPPAYPRRACRCLRTP